MTVSRLIQEFSRQDRLPVDVGEVLREVRERGVSDEIVFFHDIDLDTTVIRGFLRRDEHGSGGNTRFVSTITFGKTGHEMERLVCCKELLHLLDPDSRKTQTHSQVTELITKISLPPDISLPLGNDHVESDQWAPLEALAVLFPLGARKAIYKQFMEGKISLAWIAEVAELPVPYARMVMTGYWPRVVESLIARRIRYEDEKVRELRPRAPKQRLTQTGRP